MTSSSTLRVSVIVISDVISDVISVSSSFILTVLDALLAACAVTDGNDDDDDDDDEG